MVCWVGRGRVLAVDPAGQVMMVPLTAADLDRMAELVETYSDFPLGLVDASVISVAERLKQSEQLLAACQRRANTRAAGTAWRQGG